MPFKSSAFLSYRHSEGSFGKRFVDEFYTFLWSELELRVPEPVFYDRKAFADHSCSGQVLSQALAQSVCLLFVYTPMLFDARRPYCAIEYTAMEFLERHRLALLPADQQQHALLIPIVLRAREDVPQQIWRRHVFARSRSTV